MLAVTRGGQVAALVAKMVVKPGVDGKSKVVIKGGQDHVFTGGPAAPPLPLPLPVTVQLQNRSGECWQATYDTAGVGVNAAGFYQGSGSCAPLTA